MKKDWLNPQDLEITHTKGSGPGGQNRNKRLTGVRVRHLPTGLVVVATERRSQLQNLSEALERLNRKIAQLYFRPTPRVATKKTRGSQRRRLESKQGRSSTKILRRKPSRDDL